MNAIQCRMARAAIGLGVRELADRAGVSPDTIARLERGEELKSKTVGAIRAVLLRGVEFTNGGQPGVRPRRLRTGDLVRIRPVSKLFQDFDIPRDEVGEVTDVEPHPPQTGPTYRVWTRFKSAQPSPDLAGIFSYEFVLATPAVVRDICDVCGAEFEVSRAGTRFDNSISAKCKSPIWGECANLRDALSIARQAVDPMLPRVANAILASGAKWKQARVSPETGLRIFNTFKDLAITHYGPDVGLFCRSEGGDQIYIMTPAAARFCAVLPGEWADIDRPTEGGWAFLIGDGGELAKRNLILPLESNEQ